MSFWATEYVKGRLWPKGVEILGAEKLKLFLSFAVGSTNIIDSNISPGPQKAL